MKSLPQLNDHTIICGFGRVGHQIAQILNEEQIPFVIIDRDETALHHAQQKEWPSVLGNAAVHEQVLEKAGLAEAKVLIIAVGTDADTIFIALAGLALNPKIHIVARASSDETAEKLRKIGVQQVAQPSRIGGIYMAHIALDPKNEAKWAELLQNKKEANNASKKTVDEKDSEIPGKV